MEGAFDAETLRIARDFRRDGYAVIDFPDADFAVRIARIREKFQGQYDWEAWKAGRKDSLRVQDAWKSDEDVKAIALNPHIVELLSALYGRRVFPFQTLNFPVGTQQAIHSDSAHFSSFPERFMCGVWVALEDIGPDQGPLVYLPGTHRWPIYTNEHLGVNSSFLLRPAAQYGQLQKVWSKLAEAEGIQPKRFLARKGQALIWAANLLHGGDRQNNLSLTRWSQVTHYYFEGCCYYTPFGTDPFYGKIQFRDIIDLASGARVKHQVAGRDVPEEFVQSAAKLVVRDDAFYARMGLPADFDAAGYLKSNADVANAGVDPRVHYLEFGVREGRRWR